MTISNRYITIIIVLLCVAFVPTLMNFYFPSDMSLGNTRTTLIPLEMGTFHGKDISEGSRSWGGKHFYTEDWVRREYIEIGDGPRVVLSAARSFNTQPLFYYPEKRILGRAWAGKKVQKITLAVSGGQILVKMIKLNGLEEDRIVLYALFYGIRPVGNPYFFYLSIIPELLMGQREPMTLIFADVLVSDEEDDSVPLHAVQRVLSKASEAFLKQ